MGKKREVEKELHYKNIINKQKEMIKSLKKRANRSSKFEERYVEQEADEEIIINPPYEHKELLCPKCKSKLHVIEGSKLSVLICNDCGYRNTKKGKL